MRKRTAQLIYYTAYSVLAFVGLLADFGAFSGTFSTNPFVFYTSLSNMACTAFMVASLLRCIKNKDNADGFAPLCKYLFVVMILVTALVYNLLLNPYRSWLGYFSNIKNSLYHLILPAMFFLDWLLFYPRRRIKVLKPLLALVIPLIYVLYILLRAAIVKSIGISVSVLYPYFFLNVDRLGWQGFGTWMVILLAAILVLSYVLYALDRIRTGEKVTGSS